MKRYSRVVYTSSFFAFAFISAPLLQTVALAESSQFVQMGESAPPFEESANSHFAIASDRYIPQSEMSEFGKQLEVDPSTLMLRGPQPPAFTVSTAEAEILKTVRQIDSIDVQPAPINCLDPYVTGVGYYDQSKIEEWIVTGSPEHFGAALDVTVLPNYCPVATGYMSYNPWGLLYMRAMRWKWNPGTPYQLITNRLSPSQPGELGIDPSNSFPNNFPYALDGYFSSITLPLHISNDGATIFGSEQLSHASLYSGAQQKEAFQWTMNSSTSQNFSLLSDLTTASPTRLDCRLSSVAFGGTENLPVRKIVGLGTSDPQGQFSGGVCTGTNGRAASFAVGQQPQTVLINGLPSSLSYVAATSPDGTFNLINETNSGGYSVKSYYASTTAGTSAVPLQYVLYGGHTNYEPGRFAQAESMSFTPNSPLNTYIFGHSTVGLSTTPQTSASAAVIWNGTGQIVRNAGTSFPGLGACDAEECPSAEARDGTSNQTMVGVVYFPGTFYPNDPCRLNVGIAGAPREAFVYTPGGGMQKLREFALARIPSTTVAGAAARTELGKWSGLCEATGISENSRVISIVGIGVRRDPSNINRTMGFLIHIPKPTKTLVTADVLSIKPLINASIIP